MNLGELELKHKLGNLYYPCVLVVYGPSRTYRSTYRGEHGEVFHSTIVKNPIDAFKEIEATKYHGHYSEMIIRVYYNDCYNDGELIEECIQ